MGSAYSDFKSKFSVRVIIRWCTFALATAAIGIGLVAADSNGRLQAERLNDANYARAFSELASYTASITANLEKAAYLSAPENITAVVADLYRQAGFAKANLGALPVKDVSIDNLQNFLAQTGEYMLYLAKKSSAGSPLTDDERANVLVLYRYSDRLARSLTQINDEILRSGDISLISALLADADYPQIKDIMSINDMEMIFADYPSLIYDGPFSEGKNLRDAPLLSALPDVALADAKSIASKFTKVAALKLDFDGVSLGNIETYDFSSKDRFVKITKKGGLLLSLIVDRKQSDQKLSDSDALNNAENFVRDAGFNDCVPTYYAVENGALASTFAPVQTIATQFGNAEVILYPDLISVGVSLESGEVISFSSAHYLQNHIKRPALGNSLTLVSKSTAAASVSPLLTVRSSALALIPSEGGDEILCYEFKCDNADGKQYIVYINAITAREQKLLIVVDMGRGALVM